MNKLEKVRKWFKNYPGIYLEELKKIMKHLRMSNFWARI
jgi:hypothetical protein